MTTPSLPARRVRPHDVRRAFSLVLSLTVMAMLLLLCISVAALMAVELRVARASISQARARLNALAGARIALGEVQRLLGPDQRVSATAEILCKPDLPLDANGLPTLKPTDPAWYQGADGKTVLHPRWVGVWHAGSVTDAMDSPDLDNQSGDKGFPVQRTTQGGLVDARFLSGGNLAWQQDRVRVDSPTQSRFLGWLVSGSESSNRVGALTPYAELRPEETAVLLGRGVLGNAFNPSDADDRLGARAKWSVIPDAAGVPVARYAYWVADEGVKARVNSIDRHVSSDGQKLLPDASTPAERGYSRLLVSQANQFETTKGLVSNEMLLTGAGSITAARMATISGWGELAGLLQSGGVAEEQSLKANHWHDLSFVSSGVLADVVKGGLKKDLTAYLGGLAGGGGSDYPSLTDDTPLLSGAPYKGFSPTYGFLKDWSSRYAPRYADTQISQVLLPQATVAGLPYGSPDLSKGATPARSLLLTQAQFYSGVVKNTQTNQVGLGFAPVVTLWNPYPYAMKTDGLAVHMAYNNQIMVTVSPGATGGAVGKTFGDALYGSSPCMKFSFPSVEVKPGESITFSAPSGIAAMSRPLFNSPWTSPPTNGVLQPISPSAGFFFTTLSLPQADNDAIMANAGAVWWENNFGQGYYYYDPRYSSPKMQMYLLSGAVGAESVVQHFQVDPETARFQWIITSVSRSTIPTVPGSTPFQMNGGNQQYCSLGYRMIAVDEIGMQRGSGTLTAYLNANFSPFAQDNFRAVKTSRFPYDGLAFARSHAQSGGLFRMEVDPPFFSSYRRSSVVLNSNLAPAQAPVVDLPRAEWGVPSLATLQHAPVGVYAWSPAFIVGNSWASPYVPVSNTAQGTKDEATAWKILGKDLSAQRSCFVDYANVVNRAGATSPLFIFDWSYELNRDLFDSWHVSGMRTNSLPGLAWNRGEVWVPGTENAMNSRYISQGFAHNCPHPAYATAAGMLLSGAFNINSTSHAAWVSLLSSARGIPVPTKAGLATESDKTPFSHLSVPLSSAALSANATTPYTEEAWTGYRRLSDVEVNTLASYIVQAVKERGPFLGVSDFVNRRLLKDDPAPTDYWDFVGTIQSAIDRASREKQLINNSLESFTQAKVSRNPDATSNDGNTPMNTVTSSLTASAHHANRVVSRTVGMPTYLTQADVLQHIGGALSARSDTFTVRVLGRDEESGTTVALEQVFQRMSEVMHPLKADVNGPYIRDPQKPNFGRRVVVTKTSWLSTDEI